MTLRHLHDALAAWRPARPSDLDAIVRLSRHLHPGYPERPEVFADRLALHPSGVLLAVVDGEPAGYAIGHPWRGPAPLLDRCLGVLPGQPDSFWIHDLALLEAVRGRRLGRAGLFLLRGDAAGCGLPRLRLAAVGTARFFWQQAGFIALPDKLPDCYGDGATLMEHGIQGG